jgi:hypothetical protein
VVSDTLLFPDDRVRVGESYDVPGEGFGDVIDPSLRAHVGGTVEVVRLKDQRPAFRSLRDVGPPCVVLQVKKGKLDFRTGSAAASQNVGSVNPTGKIYFDPKQKLVVLARLSGAGELTTFPAKHLLYSAKRYTKPRFDLVYTCRILSGPRSTH